MGCASFGVSTILVDLFRVGVIGLKEALAEADASGLDDPKLIVDLMIERLAADNYVPDRLLEAYRTALWREYLRFKGEDFTPFFSRIEVVVQGAPGQERDRFVETLDLAMADFELQPVVTLTEAGPGQDHPQLIIRDEIVASGTHSRDSLKSALRRSITDW
jgi:hypothetical protein